MTRQEYPVTQPQPQVPRRPIPPKSQNAKNWDKPGSYALIIRADKSDVAQGEIVVIQIFITGYGKIEGAKLVFYPPPFLINNEWSTAKYDLHGPPDGPWTFGGNEVSLREGGAALLLRGGLKAPGWQEATMFFDVMVRQNAPIAQILTETTTEDQAPIELTLHIRKKLPSGKRLPSGSHDIDFHLTYFNGQEWKTTSDIVTLNIPSIFKRFEVQAWVAGITISVLAAADPIISFLRYLSRVVR
jgi:hypothetical protein